MIKKSIILLLISLPTFILAQVIPSNLGSSSGASLTIPGSDTQLLFNDGGVLGASPVLLYNKTTHQALITSYPVLGSAGLFVETEPGVGGIFTTLSIDAGTGRADTIDLVAIRIAVNYAYGAAAVFNNYGLFVEDQSGVGTNNWAIKTGTGLVEFGDNTIIHGSLGFTTDTTLTRGATAGFIKLDGATTGNKFAVTNGSNAEYGSIGWDDANNFRVGTQGGTNSGTARNTIIGSAVGAGLGVLLATEATSRWRIDPAGLFLPFVDNTYQIGDATHRVSNFYGALTNATGLPLSTGVTGLGTGVVTFLATPSSANLLAALTTKTGTGNAVFSISPTITGGLTIGAYTLPATDGTSNQVLQTNGSGVVSWGTASGGLTVPAILAAGTQTASNPILTLTETWNNGSVLFKGFVENITNTASAAGSTLHEWQVNGTVIAAIDKNGSGSFGKAMPTNLLYPIYAKTVSGPVSIGLETVSGGAVLGINAQGTTAASLQLSDSGGGTTFLSVWPTATQVLRNAIFAWSNGTSTTNDSSTVSLCSPDTSGRINVNDGTTTCTNLRDLGLRRLFPGSGISPDSGGLKHQRITTGSVSAGSTALVTITWTTAFADTNYTVNAQVEDSTTSSLALSVVHIESKTASAITVRVLNNAVGALTGTLDVVAIHD